MHNDDGRNAFYFKLVAAGAIIALSVAVATGSSRSHPEGKAEQGGQGELGAERLDEGLVQTYEYLPPLRMVHGVALTKDPAAASSMQIIMPERRYVEFSEDSLRGVGVESMHPLWTFRLTSEIPLPKNLRFPIIDGHVYLATSTGKLFKLSAEDGKIAWRKWYDLEFTSQPELTSYLGKNCVVVRANRRDYVVNVEDGSMNRIQRQF